MLVLAVSAVGALFGAVMPATVLAKSAAIAPPLAMTGTNAMGSATRVLAQLRPVIAGRGITTPTSCTPPSAPRDPANPLMSATTPPSSDPLAGASFFVDGPTHGAAAGEIARLLGIDSSTPVGNYLPAFPDDESWQQFLTTTVASRLPSEPAAIQYKVQMLEKIASEPEAQRISVFAEGGSPAGLSAFTTKLLCHNLTADPGTVPIITTYFMHPVLGGCPSTAQIDAYLPLFERRVNAVVQATGSQSVVYLLELDAVGSSSCMVGRHSLSAWERMLRYEVDAMATLPHAVVYIEGGYSDANTPQYAARMLNAVDISRVRGFFTNDTHINWTINEIRYGDAVSRLTHGAHFIVNTAQNGNGPKLNPHPTTQGVEDLCNPPGRGLGPRPTTSTGYPMVDAFLWTHIPGNSSGSCNGGPASGTFWPARAISLAENANGRLGPGFPSQPY
jgi:endoglucanase